MGGAGMTRAASVWLVYISWVPLVLAATRPHLPSGTPEMPSSHTPVTRSPNISDLLLPHTPVSHEHLASHIPVPPASYTPASPSHLSTTSTSLLPSNTLTQERLSTRRAAVSRRLVHPPSPKHGKSGVPSLSAFLTWVWRQAAPPSTLLLVDHTTQGSEALQEVLRQSWASLWLLVYAEDLTPLKNVLLRRSSSLPPSTTVLLLCSQNNATSVFSYVREHNLESPGVWWLVVADTDISRQLEGVLREGSQVVLAVRRSPSLYELLVAKVDRTGHPRFVLGAYWTLSPRDIHIHEPLMPDLMHVYRDMAGRQLIMATKQNMPFVGLKEEQDGWLVVDSGIDVRIMEALGQQLNFTFQVLTPPDDQWGGPLPDGNVSGIIGQVARREAHLAICEITITGSRETVVDFTSPYYLEATTMVSPAPELRSRIFAILSPFTYQVWLCIAAATLAVGPLAAVLASIINGYTSSPPRPRPIHEYSFNLFRNLVVQTNLIPTMHAPQRILFFFWCLFCYYVYALYSGTLTAVLAAPSYEPTIDSLQDLPRAVRQGFTLGMISNTSMEFLFKEAKQGIYREVWQLFDHKTPSQSFFKDPFLGFDNIIERRLVMFFPSLNGELQAIYRGRHMYYFAPHHFYPQAYGMACFRGAPFLAKFSQMLRWMTESGLVLQWRREVMYEASSSTSSTAKKHTEERWTTAISLKHCQAAFFLLLLGMGAAGLALLGELLVAGHGTGRQGPSGGVMPKELR